MNNQTIVTQQNVQENVYNRISRAGQIIDQIYAWAEEGENFAALADKERKQAKSARKGRCILRLLSPFIALQASRFFALLFALPFGISLNDEMPLGLLISAFLVCIVAIWLVPSGQKRHIAKAEEYEQLSRDREQSVNIMIDRYTNEFAVIPEKYRYPLAVHYIMELFETGRAETLPVAFDKLEEQIHRWNMEAAMQETLAVQVQQAQMLRSIQASSATSAAANTVTAMASVANLITRI